AAGASRLANGRSPESFASKLAPATPRCNPLAVPHRQPTNGAPPPVPPHQPDLARLFRDSRLQSSNPISIQDHLALRTLIHILANLTSSSGQLAKCNHWKNAICTIRNFSRTAKL